MRKRYTPLLNRLREHHANQEFSFHVPGHKFGKLWADQDSENDLLTLDATELTGLDDLHDPTDVIKEAQEMTAALYGADHSYFLVNGTTVGNLAMILTACKPGSSVLVQRNCHKSIMNGIELARVKPVMVTPEIDEQTGVATGITFEQVKRALDQYQSIDAVILTNPNYYGMTKDLSEIISYVHSKNIPVLVDEAHGAHFAIGAPFPPSSLSMGADIVVQSAHKTLPAMTMASFLHAKTGLINIKALEENLKMLQSSSPSYLLMGSLDFARSYVEALEKQDIDQIVRNIDTLIKRLDDIPQIEVIQTPKSCDWLDPIKLIIQSKTSLSGFEMQAVFEEVGIYAELADPYNVLFVLPLAPLDRIEELCGLMEQALKVYRPIEREIIQIDKLPSITELSLTRNEVDSFSKTKVSLEEAIGKISAETIIPYPPGIPIIVKGEKVTRPQVESCQLLLKKGARFQGTDLEGIQVVESFSHQESRR